MHLKTLNPYIGEQAVVHDPPLLYHLGHDPSERFNLVGSVLDDIDESYIE